MMVLVSNEEGCIDSNALIYDSSVNTDDGSCAYML